MTPGQGLALEQMAQDVAQARRVYLRAADRKRRDPKAARDAWFVYARLLQAYRKEVRKNANA